MLPDVCVLATYTENDTLNIRLNIRVIDGETRSILFKAVREQHGTSTAAILDAVTRERLRRCMHDADPTLVYSWMVLNKCSAKVRAVCGIRRGMTCHACQVNSGKIWGLDVGGVPRCMACIILRS